MASELHGLMKGPYQEQPESEGRWFSKRPEWARNRVGCSMLSCSADSRSLNQKGLKHSEPVSQARWAGLQDDAGVNLVDPPSSRP